MALPQPGTPWPPPEWATIFDKYAEWQAWWEGDPDRLTRQYSGRASVVRPSQYAGGIVGTLSRMFWGRPPSPGTTTSKLHLPVPSDLTNVAAEQVYASPPDLTSDNAGTQERLDAYVEDGLWATLLEGAESGSAFGGRFQTVTRDSRVRGGRAFLTTVHADQAIPEFVWGELVAVTFVWTLPTDSPGYTVLRHLERHELDPLGNGVIKHTLYQGTADNIGRVVPLTNHPATEYLKDSLLGDGETVDLPRTPGLWTAYIPNIRPQRAWRSHPAGRYLGRSDFHSIEPWFDEIDHAYSEWVNDIDLSRGRLIIDEAFLDVSPDVGGGTAFNTERRIFTPIGGTSASDASMKEVQFSMRVADLSATIDHFTAKVIQSAGWSQATFGEHDGDTDITATEVRAREKRTLTKRGKRIGEEQGPVVALLGKMLDLDGHPGDGADVEVSWADSVTPDAKELAETVQALRVAGAASVYRRVQIVNPDWTDGQVAEETRRIMIEDSVASPSAAWEPTVLVPAGDED